MSINIRVDITFEEILDLLCDECKEKVIDYIAEKAYKEQIKWQLAQKFLKSKKKKKR